MPVSRLLNRGPVFDNHLATQSVFANVSTAKDSRIGCGSLFRQPLAPHCRTKQKAPGLCRGLMSNSRVPLTG